MRNEAFWLPWLGLVWLLCDKWIVNKKILIQTLYTRNLRFLNSWKTSDCVTLTDLLGSNVNEHNIGLQ